MIDISDILCDTSHRPFALPVGQWKYYQEWNNALFLHWIIPLDLLRKYIPDELHIDSYEGNYYISLVAFTMQKIRPKYLPSVKFISDFHEINLRTYIDNENKKGVYFLSIEAEKHLSAFVARRLSGLPYEKSTIKRGVKTYKSKNPTNHFVLDAEFEVKEKLPDKSGLDKWLTERYCLYLDLNKKIFRYDIHHKEWELKNVVIKNLQLDYKIGDFNLSDRPPDLAHYSHGVKVLTWDRLKV
jgi:uncharacterized protein YqjF (DUF2071 family)